jgi:L-threonylcarbamoyladenylate synthase
MVGLNRAMRQGMDIAAAAAEIKAGRLVAFPTETVYGLGADATSGVGVARVYEAKARPQFNPLITHVASADEAFKLGDFSQDAKALAHRFWPGPLTIVVPRAASCPVAMLASAGLSSIALRVPAHEVALELIRASGVPLVAPSANPSGRISPTRAEHVRGYFPQLTVLDGGACAVGVESTVVSFLDGTARLLRPGGLSREALGIALGESNSEILHAPGGLLSHYAPNAAVRLNATHVEPGEALLAFGPHVPAHSGPMRNLSPSGDLAEAAACLFENLHALDAEKVARIAVMPIPLHGLGEAIHDRLTRAAAPR